MERKTAAGSVVAAGILDFVAVVGTVAEMHHSSAHTAVEKGIAAMKHLLQKQEIHRSTKETYPPSRGW